MLKYVLTYVALLLLTGITFALSFAGLGPWSIVSAMAIAIMKTVLIVMIFMHLTEHGRSSGVAFLAGVSLALILVGFAMLDVISRVPSLTAAEVHASAPPQ